MSPIIIEALIYFTLGLYSCVIGTSHSPIFCCKSARQFKVETLKAVVKKEFKAGILALSPPLLLSCVTWG